MKARPHLIGILVALCACPALTGAFAATVGEQTPVKVKLLQRLKSGHDRKGDKIHLAVAADVRGPDHTVLLPRGTPVVGTVIRSASPHLFGQPGHLEFTIDYVRVGDQLRVPLRTTAAAARGQSHAAATVAAAVLVAPLAVFVKGRNATIKEGTVYTVFVDQTTEVPTLTATAKALDAATNGVARQCIFKLKDGRTVTGVLESFQGGTYYVSTDLGRLQISQDKVQSFTASP
jgi:hypothetical protein